MTDQDVIKALECCHAHLYDDANCAGCPFDLDIEKCSGLEYEAAKLIEAKQKRIEELEERIAIMSECHEAEDDQDAW